jgi:hypothetical protein
MGERTPSKNISGIISMNINVMTTILGLFLSLHASAHQELTGPCFSLFDRFERCHGPGDLEELVDGMTSRGLISGRMAPGCPSLSVARSRNVRLTKA